MNLTLSWKQNALGLNSKNVRISLRDFLFRFQNFLYHAQCYGSRLKGLSQEATLVLSNTRELDRVPSTE